MCCNDKISGSRDDREVKNLEYHRLTWRLNQESVERKRQQPGGHWSWIDDTILLRLLMVEEVCYPHSLYQADDDAEDAEDGEGIRTSFFFLLLFLPTDDNNDLVQGGRRGENWVRRRIRWMIRSDRVSK